MTESFTPYRYKPSPSPIPDDVPIALTLPQSFVQELQAAFDHAILVQNVYTIIPDPLIRLAALVLAYDQATTRL